ncbi:uncharacterized protein LOC142363413 [Opisthocomus hoazin]|uniref:uncharacterized protein LOC142363413 n=1 Tax=Opisthocomus hoazin TaxID=30419 RepID=UPI003F5392B8
MRVLPCRPTGTVALRPSLRPSVRPCGAPSAGPRGALRGLPKIAGKQRAPGLGRAAWQAGGRGRRAAFSGFSLWEPRSGVSRHPALAAAPGRGPPSPPALPRQSPRGRPRSFTGAEPGGDAGTGLSRVPAGEGPGGSQNRRKPKLSSPISRKFAIWILTSPAAPQPSRQDQAPHGPGTAAPQASPTMDCARLAIRATVGMGISMAVVRSLLYALGFTPAGIAAGSVAARMMSLAAMANGGRVAAGSMVAVAQSLGAAGFPTAVKAALSAIGAVIRAALL